MITKISKQLNLYLPPSSIFLGNRGTSLLALVNLNKLFDFGVLRDLDIQGVISFFEMVKIKNYTTEDTKDITDRWKPKESRLIILKFYAFMNSTQKYVGIHMINFVQVILICALLVLNNCCLYIYNKNKKIFKVIKNLRERLERNTDGEPDIDLDALSNRINISAKVLKYWLKRRKLILVLEYTVFKIAKSNSSILCNILITYLISFLERLAQVVTLQKHFSKEFSLETLTIGLISSFLLCYMVDQCLSQLQHLNQKAKLSKPDLAKYKHLKNTMFTLIFYTLIVFAVLFGERFTHLYLILVCVIVFACLMVKNSFRLKQESIGESCITESMFLLYFFSLSVFFNEPNSSHMLLDFFFVFMNFVFLAKTIFFFVRNRIKK